MSKSKSNHLAWLGVYINLLPPVQTVATPPNTTRGERPSITAAAWRESSLFPIGHLEVMKPPPPTPLQ